MIQTKAPATVDGAAAVDTPSAVTVDENTVTLESSIPRAAGAISQLTLRKPNAGALRGTPLSLLLAMDIEALSTLIPRISTPMITKAEVYMLDPADVLNLAVVVTSFFMTRDERERVSPKG